MAKRSSEASRPHRQPSSKMKVNSANAHIFDGEEEQKAAAKHQSPTAVQPVQPEDAYLTGGSHSAQRKVLSLNVEGSQGQNQPHPEATAAGQHATGSFTGAPENPSSKKTIISREKGKRRS